MTNDTITTVMGSILAAITAIQPLINAIEGKFDGRDAIQILAAGLIAGLGYFIQKQTANKPRS